MLKLLSFSTCLHSRAQHALTQSPSPSCHRLGALNSLPERSWRSLSTCQRAFFCSDSSGDGIDPAVVAKGKVAEAESDESQKPSSSTVPTSSRPEDYLTIALQLVRKGEQKIIAANAEGEGVGPKEAKMKPYEDSSPHRSRGDSQITSDKVEISSRYTKWSWKVFRLSHSLELMFGFLHSLICSKMYPKVRSFLDDFVRNGDHHSVSSVFHAISTCCDSLCNKSIVADMLVLSYVKNMKTRQGLEAFKRAGDYGFKLSVLSCNPLLSNLVKERSIGDVECVYKELVRRRFDFNVITFNTVISGLCKVGRLNKAFDVMEEMKAWGLLPNVTTYNTLIDGYCKMGGPGKMYKVDGIVKEMTRNGVSPNVVTYNTMIHGYFEDENLKAAIKLF
ncbi:hypothetical protein CRG98_047582, partial [Punica granatum]